MLHQAEAIARRAHAGQERDDGGGPYIRHPERVAKRLAARFPADTALAAAAWCHDVVEDCPAITADELRAAIGEDAYALVHEVTNPSKQHPDLPRVERKRMDREHIAVISQRAKVIKLADRADNLREGAGCSDKAWLATYVRESQALAAVLTGVDQVLEAELHRALAAAELSCQG